MLIGHFSRPAPFFWIFPMPPLSFSQVLIFSLGRDSSARHFQKGLHANCRSMVRSPPTDIMHLVFPRKCPSLLIQIPRGDGLQKRRLGRRSDERGARRGCRRVEAGGQDEGDLLPHFAERFSWVGQCGTFWKVSCVRSLLCPLLSYTCKLL